MRIAILIISLILGALMTIEILDTLYIATNAVELGYVGLEPLQNAAAISMLTSLGWLVGAAFVYAKPRVARYAFGIGSLVGWVVAVLTVFDSMWLWSIVGFFITALCTAAVRERDKVDAKEALHEQFMRQQLGLPQVETVTPALTPYEVQRQAARPSWITQDFTRPQ